MKKLALLLGIAFLFAGCGAVPSSQTGSSENNSQFSSAQNNNETNNDENAEQADDDSQEEDSESGSSEDNANQLPVLNTQSLPAANEDEEYTVVLDISDPDGDSFSTSIQDGPVGLSISGASLNWTPRQVDVGTHTVRISATDSQVGSAERVFVEKTFELVVLNVNDAPVITNFNNVVADEGETIILSPIVEDEDGDEVELSYSGWMTSNTRVTTFSDAGTYSVTLTASDGQTSTSQTITVFVNDMNTRPTISGVDDMTVNEGDLVTLSPEANDAEGDDIAITYSGWMNSNTRQTTFDDAGIYEVTITANDGQATTTRTIQITVLNVNRAPIIEVTEINEMNEGEYLSVSISFSDPDGDSVSAVIEEALPDSMSFHQNPYAIVFEPIHDQSGTYDLTIVATDNAEPSVESRQTFSIIVNDTLSGPDEWEIVTLAATSCTCEPKVDAGIVFFCSGGEIYKYESAVTTKVSPDGVVDNVGGRPCPQTHNGRAAWSANGRIYYYDGIETNDVGGGYWPRLYGTNVGWSDGSTNADIYFYDGITDTTTQLTDSDSVRDIVPNIYGDRLVWVKYVEPSSRDLVYYFDGEEHIIASNVSGDTPPTIGPNMVAWIGNWGNDASEYEIFAYDGNQVLQVTDNGIWDGNPYVTATDDIVWAERGAPIRLLRYTNEITSVEDEGWNMVNPVMENNVYAWRRSLGSWEIAVKKNNSISSLISYEFATPGDPDTDGTNVVWHLQGGGVYLARPE